MSDPVPAPSSLTWAQFKACWQEIDCRVSAGEYTPEQAVRAAYESGLVCRSAGPNLPHEIREVLTFMPERALLATLGPWLLVAFEGDEGPRVYRPRLGDPW